MKKRQLSEVKVTDMCMLGWVSGLTLNTRVRNDRIKDSLKIALEEKLRETRLR